MELRVIKGMGGILFRKSDPAESAKKQRLRELDAQIAEKRKEISKVRRETTRVFAQAEQYLAESEQEKKDLQVLRNETSKRVKLAEEKEAKLLEMEKIVSHGAKTLRSEQAVLGNLKNKEAALRSSIANLESDFSEKNRALSATKREHSSITAETEKHIIKSKSNKKALQKLIKEAGKRVKLAEAKEAKLREAEKRISQREKIVKSEELLFQKLKQKERVLRSDINALEDEHDKKEASLKEKRKTHEKLSDEIGDLSKKRAALHRLEEKVQKTLAKERQTLQEVVKKEKRVAAGAKMIARQEDELGRHEQRLKSLRSEIEKTAALKKRLDSDITKGKKYMLAVERELADMEYAVKDVIKTKESFDKKRIAISERERKLSLQERRIDQKKIELDRIQIDVQAAQKARRDIASLLEDKKHVLQDLKATITENSSTIKELHVQEIKARKAGIALIKTQHKEDKKLRDIASREKEAARKEAVWIEHDKALKEATRMLKKDKKEFEDLVSSRKAELLLIQQEWGKKLKELREEKQGLRLEKADVRKLVESDVILLKDKEDELVETVAAMEHDRKKLENEEKAVLRRIAQLEKEKSLLERAEKSLREKEKKVLDGERVLKKGMEHVEAEKRKIEQEKDKIYRSKQLKKNLPQMERKYELLRKTMEKLRARVMEEGTQPSKTKLLKEREKDIALRTKGIETEIKKLMEREHEVEALEKRKDRAFSEYLREEVERVQMGKPGRELANPEIHAMIDDSRENVMRGNMDDAVRLIAEAEVLVERLADQNQRRVLMYDIRDVQASIKLASLT